MCCVIGFLWLPLLWELLITLSMVLYLPPRWLVTYLRIVLIHFIHLLMVGMSSLILLMTLKYLSFRLRRNNFEPDAIDWLELHLQGQLVGLRTYSLFFYDKTNPGFVLGTTPPNALHHDFTTLTSTLLQGRIVWVGWDLFVDGRLVLIPKDKIGHVRPIRIESSISRAITSTICGVVKANIDDKLRPLQFSGGMTNGVGPIRPGCFWWWRSYYPSDL